MLELIKTLGSVRGIASLAITVSTKIREGRPMLSLRATKEQGKNVVRLRVLNTRKTAIWIKNIQPNSDLISIDDLWDDGVLLHEVMQDEFQIRQIDHESWQDYIFQINNDVSCRQRHMSISITVYWRDLSRPNLPKVPVWLSTSIDQIQNIQASI